MTDTGSTTVLAECLAHVSPSSYASHPMCFRTLFKTAFSSSPSILSSTTTSVFPTCTSVLLSQTTIGLRKAAHTTLSFYMSLTRPTCRRAQQGLHVCPGPSPRYGTWDLHDLILPLVPPCQGCPARNPDNLFLQTKGNLFDAFHNLLTALLTGLTPADPSRPSIYSL
ncbi:hypothetical protein BGY98DRAFT_1099738 [Russula aff. rugulosa BPL654]|nr:hypothetical protein BGY98DRAFT_1099738 [Russula aff. rugulosa BPL654]